MLTSKAVREWLWFVFVFGCLGIFVALGLDELADNRALAQKEKTEVNPLHFSEEFLITAKASEDASIRAFAQVQGLQAKVERLQKELDGMRGVVDMHSKALRVIRWDELGVRPSQVQVTDSY